MKDKVRNIVHKICIIILIICLALLGSELYKIFNTSQQIRYVQHVAGETAKKDDNFYPDWKALRKRTSFALFCSLREAFIPWPPCHSF